MKTRTGGYPIGFRCPGGWQDDLGVTLEWAKEEDLEVIDLARDGDVDAKQVLEAGLRIGTIDLVDSKGMISADAGRRAKAIAANAEYIRACAAYGSLNYFVVSVPEDPGLPRADNFGYMVESYRNLVPVLEESQAYLSIEGWPGPGAVCCTPETYRAFIAELDSEVAGINYDPSHLIRMNIDPLRFLQEFSDRVRHVHGKDTALLTENLYEYGSEQPATFAPRIPFGAHAWRYTIPGHGVMRWTEAFRILEAKEYAGCVSIELEDANFNGARDSERLGIRQGARFLEGC
jgi:sugar phosphate isomerase/epimerase